YEIAGLIDRQANKIAVSRKFPPETMRFTGAHELGHWLMHSKEVMHRDRPIKGLSSDGAARSPREQEADYFAACFLIPKKPLVAAFELAFKTKTPFVFNDTSAFWLCGTDPDSLLRADSSSLDRALALASAEHYAGTHFISLAKQFRVSITSMAIRLKELKLLEE
ncbi:MAG: ImmA/IrrE family metallo-endopeptidase, partial [Hypericibacter sp.]